MFGVNTYLIWIACFIGAPLVLLALWRGRALWRQRRALLWVTAGALVGGWIWDALAVRFGVWYNAPNLLAGWWWGGLPLEEWLWITGVSLMFSSLTIALAEGGQRGKRA